jgi:DNA-binding transcriptional LysR family regulator
MENAADLLLRSAGVAGSAAGVVKIVCSEILATEVLPRAFANLRALQPDLRLEVSIDNSPNHVIGGAADLSIQFEQPTQPGIASTLACKIASGFFAHSHYVSRFGAPASADDLKRHSLIGSDSETSGIDLLLTRGLDIDANAVAVRSDSYSAQLAAIRAGTGIGAVYVPLAARDPDLVRILPRLEFEREAWLAMDEGLVGDRRLDVAFDLIAARLAAFARENRPPPPGGAMIRGGPEC